MSPGSSTESYPAFARIGLRENPRKNLNQVTCPDWDSNPGHLVSQPDALTVTPQVWTTSSSYQYLHMILLQRPIDLAYLHRIGIYQSPNCQLCNSNQEMDSEHLKICASVADHDNIFEKYWSPRGQMTLLAVYDILYGTRRHAGLALALVIPSERDLLQSHATVFLSLSLPSLPFLAFKDTAYCHIETDNCFSVLLMSSVYVCIDVLSLVQTMPQSPQDIARAVALIDDGRSPRYAAATIGAPYITVQEAVKWFWESQSYSRRPGSGRKRKTSA
ncbi:hypothetical protein ANN_24691 [Periplaneta americana]|uniref:Uncharacterized protein n=1 Tax=Periplaneta americana TaxID=6978 RepID=A0ABQ8RZ97_PERAM|nr:hypothetical protein ANN_24691 [Periplaneta americana]